MPSRVSDVVDEANAFGVGLLSIISVGKLFKLSVGT